MPTSDDDSDDTSVSEEDTSKEDKGEEDAIEGLETFDLEDDDKHDWRSGAEPLPKVSCFGL